MFEIRIARTTHSHAPGHGPDDRPWGSNAIEHRQQTDLSVREPVRTEPSAPRAASGDWRFSDLLHASIVRVSPQLDNLSYVHRPVMADEVSQAVLVHDKRTIISKTQIAASLRNALVDDRDARGDHTIR